MKKAFCAILAGVILSCSPIVGFAAADTTVSVSSATYLEAEDSVYVSGTLTNYSEGQNITVMATGIVDGVYNPEEILFIDQQDAVVGENGAYTISFKLSELAKENTRYLVRVGGTNVAEPASMVFLFGTGGEVTIIYGDVNNDGKVDSSDAAELLQYVLDPSNTNISEQGLKNAQIQKEPVEDLTATEVSLILQKALKSGFKFPIES